MLALVDYVFNKKTDHIDNDITLTFNSCLYIIWSNKNLV